MKCLKSFFMHNNARWHLSLITFLLMSLSLIIYPATQEKSELPSYWNLFIQNKIDEAQVELVKSTLDNPYTYYEASSAINNLNGDYDKMLSDMLEIINSSPNNPLNEVYIRRINELKVLLPNYDETILAYQKLLESGVENALNKALITDFLSEDFLNRDKLDEAKRLIKKSGFVQCWMYVAGSFAKDGETDIDYLFPIETVGNGRDRSLQAFSDKIVKLSEKPNPLSKYLNLSSYIFPSVAIAYAYTSIECEAEQDIILRVLTQASIKLWINGKLIVYKNVNVGDYRNECLAEAKLIKGKNDIVVKLQQKDGDWRFGLQIVSKAGKDFFIKYSIVDKPNFKVDVTNPDFANDSFDKSNRYSSINLTATIGCLEILKDKSDLISLLQKSYYFSSINDFDSARESLDLAKKLYPDCAYVYSQIGRLDIIESSYRSRSSTRLENDAKVNYEQVLKLMPNSLVANQGLGLFHYFQKRYDDAIKYFKKELEVKQDFFQANYFLSQSYKGKGWEVEEIDALKKVLQQFPSHQSSMLDLIDHYISKGLYNEAEKTALDGLKNGVPFINITSKLMSIYQNSGNEKKLLDILEKLIQRNRDDVNSIRLMAETYKKSGDFGKTITVYGKLLEISPQNFDVEKDLGEVLILSGDKEEGLIHLENALKKNPGDYSTRTLYESYKNIEPFYKKYDVSLNDIKIGDYTTDEYPRASEVFLIDVGVFQIHPDGSYDEMTHQAVKIFNKTGRENWAEIVVPSNARILIARTIAPDGQIFEPENVQYLDSGTTLSMPKLEDNSIVEISYVRSTSNTYSFWRRIVNTTFYFQQLENPETLARLVLINSNQHPLKTRLTPFDFEPEVTDSGDYKVYKWEKRDMKGLKDEPQMPELDKLSVNVKFYTDTNCSHILNNILAIFTDKLKVNENIKNKALELIVGTEQCSVPTERDKIEAIYNYIRDEIKDSTNGGDTVDIFEIQTGNVAEKSYLLYVMLQSIGIDCYIAYATPDKDKENLIIPNYAMFYEPFIYIPSLYEEDCCVRFVSKYEPFTNVKDSIEGKIAAVFIDNKPRLMRIGGKEQDEGGVKTSVKNEINDNGIITLNGELIMDGNYNRSYREIFSDPKKKEQIAQMIILRLYNKLNDLKLEFLNEKELNKKLAIKFSGSLADYLQEETDGLALRPFPDDLNLSSFITSETREFDYENSDLSFLRFNEVEYKIPNTLIIRHIPEDYVVASPYGNYSITYQLENDKIKVKRSAIINGIMVKKERWNEFIKFCREVDEHDKQKIMLKKIES